MDLRAQIEAAAQVSPQMPTVLPPVRGRTLLIDGDYLAYWATGGNTDDPGRAIRVARDKIEQLQAKARAEYVEIHLTGSGSTKGDRYLIARLKPYQGGRKGERPKYWQLVRQMLESREDATVWMDREADDGLAMRAANFMVTRNSGEQLIFIASPDKDLRMVPGTHIDWSTGDTVQVLCHSYRVVHADKVYGYCWFLTQLLRGDPVDNIPGLPHTIDEKGKKKLVGDVGAAALLAGTENPEQGWTVVLREYMKTYPDTWADELCEQAALLWLRRGTAADPADWWYWEVTEVLGVPPIHETLSCALARQAAMIKNLRSLNDPTPEGQ